MKIKKYLKSSSDWFAQLPSFGYAIIFLSLIPIFALLYYFLPTHFYHSSAPFELSINEFGTKILERDLVSGMLKGMTPDITGWPDWVIDLENIKISKHEIVSDGFQFLLRVTCYNKIANRSQIYTYKAEIEKNYSYRMLEDNGEDRRLHTLQLNKYYLIDCDLHPDGSIARAKEIKPPFSDEYIIDLEKNICVPTDSPGHNILELSSELSDNLKSYFDAKNGFPSEIPGYFFRMLYLSATSVIGSSDIIIPLSGLTGLLVTIQTILGLIIVGLFFNSLSYEKSISHKN